MKLKWEGQEGISSLTAELNRSDRHDVGVNKPDFQNLFKLSTSYCTLTIRELQLGQFNVTYDLFVVVQSNISLSCLGDTLTSLVEPLLECLVGLCA